MTTYRNYGNVLWDVYIPRITTKSVVTEG